MKIGYLLGVFFPEKIDEHCKVITDQLFQGHYEGLVVEKVGAQQTIIYSIKASEAGTGSLIITIDKSMLIVLQYLPDSNHSQCAFFAEALKSDSTEQTIGFERVEASEVFAAIEPCGDESHQWEAFVRHGNEWVSDIDMARKYDEEIDLVAGRLAKKFRTEHLTLVLRETREDRILSLLFHPRLEEHIDISTVEGVRIFTKSCLDRSLQWSKISLDDLTNITKNKQPHPLWERFLSLLASIKQMPQHDLNAFPSVFVAVKHGDIRFINDMKALGANLDVLTLKGGRNLVCAAAEFGQVASLKALIRYGVEVNQVMDSGATAVHIAAQNGHMAVLKSLIQHGADVNKGLFNGHLTPACLAARGGHAHILTVLAEHGADLSKGGADGATLAYVAAEKGHVRALAVLAKHDVDLNKAMDDSTTPAWIAAFEGHVKALDVLAAHGADLNKESMGGFPPMFIAVIKNSVAVVTCLLKHGCDATTNIELTIDEFGNFLSIVLHGSEYPVEKLIEKLKNEQAETSASESHLTKYRLSPLIIANLMEFHEIVTLLENHAARVLTPNSLVAAPSSEPALVLSAVEADLQTKLSPLDIDLNPAVSHGEPPILMGQSEAVDIFLEHGVDLSGVRVFDTLVAAVHQGNKELIQRLAMHGADLDQADDDGVTALLTAVSCRNIRILRLLCQLGADLNKETRSFKTPVLLAVELGDVEALIVLATHGADLNKPRQDGLSPILMATMRGFFDVVACLLKYECNSKVKWKPNSDNLEAIASELQTTHITTLCTKLIETCQSNPRKQLKLSPAMIAAEMEFQDIATLFEQFFLAQALPKKLTKEELLVMLRACSGTEILPLLRTLAQKQQIDLNQFYIVKTLAECWMENPKKWQAISVKNVEKSLTSSHDSWSYFKHLVNAVNRKETLNCSVVLTAMNISNGHFFEAMHRFYLLDLLTDHNVPITHLAVRSRNAWLLELLAQLGHDLNEETSNGETPAFIAAQEGLTSMLHLLAKHGANLDKATTDGVTPAFIAVNNGHYDVLKVLAKYHADLNKPQREGLTPLFAAVRANSREIVALLLASGCDVMREFSLALKYLNRLDVTKSARNQGIVRRIIEEHLAKIPPSLNKTPPSLNVSLSLVTVAKLRGFDEVAALLEERVLQLTQASTVVRPLTPVLLVANQAEETEPTEILSSSATTESIDHANQQAITSITPPAPLTGISGNLLLLMYKFKQQIANEGWMKVLADLKKSDITDMFLQQECQSLRRAVSMVGIDLDGATVNGMSPVFMAVENRDVVALDVLGHLGADLNKENSRGFTPACIAAKRGLVAILKILAKHGADLNKANQFGATPAFIAAKRYIAVLEFLIQHGADLNKANRFGATPAYIAAKKGDVAALEILLKQGVDLNQSRTFFGETPVHVSAQKGDVVLFELLVKHGADFNQTNVYGETPVWMVAKRGHISLLESLVQKGADLNKANKKGETPAYIAAEHGHIDILEVLIQQHVDLNKENADGDTPACIAVKKGCLAVLELLAKNGADLNKANKKGETPLSIAAQKQNIRMLFCLAQQGVDLNQASINDDIRAYIAADQRAEQRRVDLMRRLADSASLAAQSVVSDRSLESHRSADLVARPVESDRSLESHRSANLVVRPVESDRSLESHRSANLVARPVESDRSLESHRSANLVARPVVIDRSLGSHRSANLAARPVVIDRSLGSHRSANLAARPAVSGSSLESPSSANLSVQPAVSGGGSFGPHSFFYRMMRDAAAAAKPKPPVSYASVVAQPPSNSPKK